MGLTIILTATMSINDPLRGGNWALGNYALPLSQVLSGAGKNERPTTIWTCVLGLDASRSRDRRRRITPASPLA